MDKLNFLKNEFPKLLKTLKPDAKGNWGVLTGQGMVEHMTNSFSEATGNNNQKLHTPVEHVQKYQAFMLSDKEFKPNTKNALMSETPAQIVKTSMEIAIADLEKEIASFISYFENNKEAKLMNPFFGELNFEQWTHLLYKHAVHHSKQFGLLS